MKINVISRIEKIKEYLLVHNQVSINDLSNQLGVTPETLRKDFSLLETRGFLYRTHGGAILRNSNIDVPFSLRSQEKQELKNKICTKVLDYINNESMIYIDPSSTALPLGKLLRLKKDIVLVTNSIDLLHSASDSKLDLIFLGGDYNRNGRRTGGFFPIDMINRMSFDVSIFGTDGFLDDGPGTQSKDAVFMNKSVIQRSKVNILISDSSKFSLSCRYQYANYSDFSIFITDYIPKEWTQKINITKIITV